MSIYKIVFSYYLTLKPIYDLKLKMGIIYSQISLIIYEYP